MTTTLDNARDTLTWAANRLTEAHQSIDLPDPAFAEVLDTYLLANRAYHQAIRDTNTALRQYQPPTWLIDPPLPKNTPTPRK